MARVHIFADESGNFDFSRNPGASRFFVLTTAVFPHGHDAIAGALRTLRFELAWNGIDLRRGLHATEDSQRVRDRVFGVLRDHDFRVDATILDKPKARPETRSSDERFYRFAWLFHLRNVLPSLLAADSELLLVAASVGTGNRRRAFLAAVESALWEATDAPARVAFWPASADACLQAADYCAWAIQRKWERGDERSYDLIRNRIVREHDLFYRGASTFY